MQIEKFLGAKLVYKIRFIARKTYHVDADLLQTKENRHLATNMHDAESFPTVHCQLSTVNFLVCRNVFRG